MPPFDFTALYVLLAAMMLFPVVIWLVALAFITRGKRAAFFRHSIAGLCICVIGNGLAAAMLIVDDFSDWFRQVFDVVGIEVLNGLLAMILIAGGALLVVTIYALHVSLRREN